MALPASGAISMSQVNTELKKTATAQVSLGDSAVRTLAKKSSGQISMSDLHGKSSSTHRIIIGKQTYASNYYCGFREVSGANSMGDLTPRTVSGVSKPIVELFAISNNLNSPTISIDGLWSGTIEVEIPVDGISVYFSFDGRSTKGTMISPNTNASSFSQSLINRNWQTVDINIRTI